MATTSAASLTCQRCLQSLQLDESLSDENLASTHSSFSNDGLTKSNYDVISSKAVKLTSTAAVEPSQKSTDTTNIKDPELREAVLAHRQSRSPRGSIPSLSEAPNSLSSRLSLHVRLFDLVSSFVPSAYTKTASSRLPRELALGIDHPLCLDCSDYCLEVIQKQLEEVRREREAYKQWNKEIEKQQNTSREEEERAVKEMEDEIQELQGLVKKAIDSLYKSEKLRMELQGELEQLERDEKELEREEAEFWAAHSQLLSETTALESTKASLQRSIEVSQATLSRLNSTNVFADAFCIGHEGSSSSSSNRKRASGGGTGLATINGLRFGTKSSVSSSSRSSTPATVEWNEVNAAWGQVALLIEVLRFKIGDMLSEEGGSSPTARFSDGPERRKKEFIGWRVHPKGSTSFLDKLAATPTTAGEAGPSTAVPTESVYELYHAGPWIPITSLLHSKRFDAAMCGILDCVSQLYDWAAKASTKSSARYGEPPRMVHHISGEKIGDLSIKLAGKFFTSEETWSRALKYLLVDLQILMQWATMDELVA